MTARLREGSVWFLLLTGFYLALVTEHDWPEIVTGVAAGAVGAAAAMASGTAERGRYSPAWRWLGWLSPLPLHVCLDTGRLAVRLVRRILRRRVEPGGIRELDVFPGGDGARSRARRAIGAWTLSYAPGSYVVDIDPDTGTVLLHDLGGSGPSPVERRLTG